MTGFIALGRALRLWGRVMVYGLCGADQGRVVSRRRGLYLGTHTVGDRRQILNASCHAWPGAFITSYRSEDLEEQAWAWQETVWLLNPLTFICNPAFRSHGQGPHQKTSGQAGHVRYAVSLQRPLDRLSAELLSPPLLRCL